MKGIPNCAPGLEIQFKNSWRGSEAKGGWKRVMIVDTCYHCGKRIYLVKSKRTRRWMHSPKDPDSWKCPAGLMPHATKEQYDYEQYLTRKVSATGAIKQSEPEVS